ncbi:hypothetical protein K435DRAFT_868752 [Dendrothele bispora CBS 962.96]|uniref:Uncharacterized protein n=1 Tax=Dendrothele bispora (strain CBS 962.96) TaxID=1314807 RepID=A0A4S8LBE2_DENBC|nr:hypothetical protein K435DRAFT_868752 [Dendrothele bispora CBS 962.96]
MMGGLVGAAIVYANYIKAIDIVEGGRHIRTLKTAGLFSTYALDYMSNPSCFFVEITASALIILIVAAWRNGIASNYELGDCRFDPCGGH